VPQQGGLARAEEAGDDGDGKFGQCFHRMPLAITAGMGDESRAARMAGGAFVTGSPRPVMEKVPRQVSWLATCWPWPTLPAPSRAGRSGSAGACIAYSCGGSRGM
jgi:hypothetical protein